LIDNLAFLQMWREAQPGPHASFDGCTITYGFGELDALVLAHAAIKSGAGMPSVKTYNLGAKIAECMHEPWRHRAVSIHKWALSLACQRTKVLIRSGIDAHWPRHSRLPVSSTTQTAVIFCETSKPTKKVIG
jgi:hypothetical protein